MEKKPRPEPDDPEQSQRFVDTAKQLEADETGTWFDRAFGAVKPSTAQENCHRDDNKEMSKP